MFVYDRQTGTTTRVSVRSNGKQANRRSEEPAISADGRYVAFYSKANNLVRGDTNHAPDVFVHDRRTGTTSRVSVPTRGRQANDASGVPSISADGRYVAFSSSASNLVGGDTNEEADAFVHDRRSGRTSRVSVKLWWEPGPRSDLVSGHLRERPLRRLLLEGREPGPQ